MNNTECPDCGQRTFGNVISHEVFCCDFYVVSAPYPTSKQEEIERVMTEKIVNPLEQRGYKCYLGYRDIPGGEFVIQALSYPITIIPTTIIPVYKDRHFSAIRNLLIIPEFLNRIVFVRFDPTPIEPSAVSKNCLSVDIDNFYLLSRLEKTIKANCLRVPLSARRSKFETSSRGSDPQSTVSSAGSVGFYRESRFRRSDVSRVSFRLRPLSVSVISEGQLSIETASELTSPEELLSCCYNRNENIRNCAAKRLRKLIQENFCSKELLPLETLEKQTRNLIEKHDSIVYMKLYSWILVAIFFTIYKCNDLNLKRYIKSLTLPKCKISKDPFDRLCQHVYLNLVASLHAKMKAWPDKLDNNKLYVKKFEKCLEMINIGSLDRERTPPDALIRILISLPRDMKHIFIVTIAEKQLQKKFITSSVTFLDKIFDILGKKHWPLFLDVLEQLTEYTLENYTEGSLEACMEILHRIIIWNLQRRRRKNDKLSIVLKHFMSKLVYHHDTSVRHFVTPLMLGKDFVSLKVSKLGNSFIKVDEELVEMCIREHMHHNCSGIVLSHEVPTTSLHTSLYEARTLEGHSLVYIFKQRTLNDILQTNRTVDAYEHFQEMSRLIKDCQKHENIVAQRNVPQNGILPFFVVENGKPLLQFLHAKENQLTWFQMIQILIDITTAVHHCHSNKIILCDITPASFIIVDEGSLKIKLASFLHARSGECEDSSSTADGYINDINFLCFQGDSKENIAAYFSSPESLSTRTFSKYTDVWMLAATFYSVLLYGRRPFEELSHLNIFNFVKEITTHHTASKPISIPPDLWNILKTNLDFSATKRTLTETVLQDLKTYQKDLGPRSHTFYTVTTFSSHLHPEEIERGYVDDTGSFILGGTEELEGASVDSVISQDGQLIQTVTARMSLKTRRQILQLDHENILKVNEIKADCYKTVLVSNAFNGHRLSKPNQEISIDQLFSYFKQMTLGLQELHKHNIVLCDLTCSSIYINPYEGTLKIGHLGRAVSLDGISTFPYAIKLMPSDASKWSAPEVRDNSMYSKASDIFNLAAVFWEAISLHINTIYQNQPLESFQHCRTHLEEYCLSVSIQDTSEDPVNKLVKCVLKCWNRNPTKRPALDMILNTIEEIKTHNAPGRSMAIETIYQYNYEDSEEEEILEDCVYDTIIDYSSTDLYSNSSDGNGFSSTEFYMTYAWESVVREYTLTRQLPNNPEHFIELKETSTYEDIGIPLRNKTRSKRGIIL